MWAVPKTATGRRGVAVDLLTVPDDRMSSPLRVCTSPRLPLYPSKLPQLSDSVSRPPSEPSCKDGCPEIPISKDGGGRRVSPFVRSLPFGGRSSTSSRRDPFRHPHLTVPPSDSVSAGAPREGCPQRCGSLPFTRRTVWTPDLDFRTLCLCGTGQGLLTS